MDGKFCRRLTLSEVRPFSMKNLDYAYDEYLKAHEIEVMKAIADFNHRIEKTPLRYGRFPIPAFYKPHFITFEQEHLLKRVSATLSSVLNIAVRLYFEEKHFSHLFRIPSDAAELIKIDPGYSQAVVFSRYDALLEGHSLKLLDFNSDTSAGPGYSDQLEEMLLEEPFLADFFREHAMRRTARVQGILDTLLEIYEEFGGLETPRIAIMDWRNVRAIPELEYLKNFFENKGYKAMISDPRELKFKGGKLYHKDTRIDIIYRRATLDELIAHSDEVQDLIKAYKARAVCMANPLRAKLTSSKTLMSILTNPAYDHFFTENENQVKRECIPWTRRISDMEAFYGGKKIYMLDFLKDEKESIALKPAESYGGKGVTLGPETRDQDWNEALDHALKEDWIVQESIHVPIITVPAVINQKLDFDYKKFNFNVLVFGGKYAGGFVKVSQDSVVNVTKSGGFMPSIASEAIPERFSG